MNSQYANLYFSLLTILGVFSSVKAAYGADNSMSKCEAYTLADIAALRKSAIDKGKKDGNELGALLQTRVGRDPYDKIREFLYTPKKIIGGVIHTIGRNPSFINAQDIFKYGDISNIHARFWDCRRRITYCEYTIDLTEKTLNFLGTGGVVNEEYLSHIGKSHPASRDNADQIHEALRKQYGEGFVPNNVECAAVVSSAAKKNHTNFKDSNSKSKKLSLSEDHLVVVTPKNGNRDVFDIKVYELPSRNALMLPAPVDDPSYCHETSCWQRYHCKLHSK